MWRTSEIGGLNRFNLFSFLFYFKFYFNIFRQHVSNIQSALYYCSKSKKISKNDKASEGTESEILRFFRQLRYIPWMALILIIFSWNSLFRNNFVILVFVKSSSYKLLIFKFKNWRRFISTEKMERRQSGGRRVKKGRRRDEWTQRRVVFPKGKDQANDSFPRATINLVFKEYSINTYR